MEYLYIYLFVLILIVIICTCKYNESKFFSKTLNNREYVLDGVNHVLKQKIPKDTMIISDDLAKKLKYMYKSFEKVADQHNVKFFVISGTLLGAYRHQGFIPWDDDVDMCMEIKYKDTILSKKFQNDLKKEGLKLIYDNFSSRSIKIIFLDSFNMNPPFIDIFFGIPTDDNKIGLCQKMNINIIKAGSKDCILYDPKLIWEREWIYPIKKMKFEDIKVYVPNNTEIILSNHYSTKALTEAKVTPGHSGQGWVFPAINTDVSSFDNKLITIDNWEKIIPLRKEVNLQNIKYKNKIIPGILNPIAILSP